MLVARELARLLWQTLAYSARARRPMLWLLVVAGAVLVMVSLASAAAAPVLIYPVL